MKIYLVTKNQGKLLAAKSVFDKLEIEVQSVEKDYPEIQADSSLEIAKYTAMEAAKELNALVVREDHSLFIEALGIPGPYTNYMEKKIPADKLVRLIKQLGNNKGYFEVATVLAYPNGETFEYVFQIPMTFGEESKSITLNSWNEIIRLNNETRAITEYPETERFYLWNQGYEAVAKHLTKTNSS